MELGGTNDNKLQRRELMSRRLKQMRRESGGGERRVWLGGGRANSMQNFSTISTCTSPCCGCYRTGTTLRAHAASPG